MDQRRSAQVEVADAVWRVVGLLGLRSLLKYPEDLYCCERCQRVIDTRTHVAIAVSVEVSQTPGWRTHRLFVTHASCAPSQVRHVVDLRGDAGQDAPANQQPGYLLGVRSAGRGPTAMVVWEAVGQWLHWPAPAGQEPTVIDETVQVYYEWGEVACAGPITAGSDPWQQAVQEEGYCVALAGVGLGLGTRDHFDQLLAAMPRGRVGAGIVACRPQ